jgi:tetratricopeptide (TPR) repeat protein
MTNQVRARAPRRVVVVDDSALAQRIGRRLREARQRRGISQRELAGDRFTGQYVSMLERGAVKPSMAALNYLSERLGVAARDLLDPPVQIWSRVEADLKLASGSVTEAADLYSDLAGAAPSPPARAEALLGLAEALCRLDRGTDAVAPAAEAVELFQSAGRDIDAAWATYWLASAQYQSDNSPEARALLDGLLQRVRNGLDVEPGFKLRLLTAIASVIGWMGDHQAALSYLEEGKQLIGGLDTRARAAYLYSLAQNYKNAGDLEAAATAGLRSLALYAEIGSELEVGVLYNHLALTYLRLGNVARAREYAHQAAETASRLDDRRAQAWVRETQAEIALDSGDHAEAIAMAEAVSASPDASPETKLSALITAARAHRTTGVMEQAKRCYEAAAELARASSPTRRRQVLAEYADFAGSLGEDKLAIELYRDAVAG